MSFKDISLSRALVVFCLVGWNHLYNFVGGHHQKNSVKLF